MKLFQWTAIISPEIPLFSSICERVLAINKMLIYMKNTLENSHEFAFI